MVVREPESADKNMLSEAPEKFKLFKPFAALYGSRGT
jgi:hypothetical protein